MDFDGVMENLIILFDTYDAHDAELMRTEQNTGGNHDDSEMVQSLGQEQPVPWDGRSIHFETSGQTFDIQDWEKQTRNVVITVNVGPEPVDINEAPKHNIPSPGLASSTSDRNKGTKKSCRNSHRIIRRSSMFNRDNTEYLRPLRRELPLYWKSGCITPVKSGTNVKSQWTSPKMEKKPTQSK